MTLPNPFEEMGRKPSLPIMPISEFATACWEKQVMGTRFKDGPWRKEAIDLWWFACDEWLKEVHNEPWMQWPVSKS